MNVPTDFLPLLNHLHRGGQFGYWWTGNDNRSYWWKVGTPSAVPDVRANTYFGVHPTTAIPPKNAKGEAKPPEFVRSQYAYIAAINCLYGDFDAKLFADGKAGALAKITASKQMPTVIIDSGGGYHCYWLLRETFTLSTDADRQRAKRIQAAWTKFVGSDDGAKDLSRYLRVPGTKNYKADYKPNYPTVEIIHADYDCLYDLATLEALLPPAPVTPGRTKRATPTPSTIDAGAPMVTLSTIATVAQQLQRLSTDRKDSYTGWLAVGMALRELGTMGLDLWDTWSHGSAEYEPGCCAAKWETLRVDAEKITLASLGHWANEDTPAETPTAVDDQTADLDADALRDRLRTAQTERDDQRRRADRLDDWRKHALAVIAKPSKELSPAQKIVALSLHIELDYRRENGMTEPAPILIGTIEKDDRTIPGLADRAGVSTDTYSKALPKLAAAGAIAYEQKRDTKTGHSRVWIAPAGYFDPATWTTTTARNHGGTRVKHCADCGSTALIEQTRVVCLNCGCQQGDAHERAVNPNPQDAALGSVFATTTETPIAESPTTNPQDAVLGTPSLSRVPQDAVRSTTLPAAPAPQPQTVAPQRLANAWQLARYARERERASSI